MSHPSGTLGGVEITLEAVVGILGLFLGGYGGVRIGALSRMHLEDRRTLLDDELPQLERALRRVPDTNPMMPPTELTGYENAIEKIQRRVDVLPWADRSSWARADELFPHARIAGALHTRKALEVRPPPPDHHANGQRWRDGNEYLTAWTRSTSREVADLMERSGNGDAVSDIWRERWEFDDRLEEFRDHIHRQVRPGWFRRVAGWRYRVSLMAKGPWRV